MLSLLAAVALILPESDNWPIKWEAYDNVYSTLDGVELYVSETTGSTETISIVIVNNSKKEIRYYYETIKAQKQIDEVWLHQVDTRANNLPTPMVPFGELKPGACERFELNLFEVIPPYYLRDVGEYRLHVPIHVRESDNKWMMAYACCPLRF